jgi:hypothetical protein
MVDSDGCRCSEPDPRLAPSCIRSIFQSEPVLVLFGIAVGILSVGASVALCLFVWLAFKFPGEANIVIPLMLSPVTTMILMHGGKIFDSIKAHRGDSSIPGAEGDAKQRVIKLGSNGEMPTKPIVASNERRE